MAHSHSLIHYYFSNSLLPESYICPEDFINQTGRIVLVYEETENLQKQDTGKQW